MHIEEKINVNRQNIFRRSPLVKRRHIIEENLPVYSVNKEQAMEENFLENSVDKN